MYKKQRYTLLVVLVNLNLIISLILILFNLILILWVNNSIVLSKIVYNGLFIFLVWFEFVRTILIITSGILTGRIKYTNRKIKTIILSSLVTGFGFNLWFLIRLFGFACFAPAYSFSCMPFICISYVLIIIKEYDNNQI
ncbi:MAG: hypothetical protein ACFFDH_12580 [Promethearchaeota archaeon]